MGETYTRDSEASPVPKQPKPPEEAAKAEEPSDHHFLKIEDLAARWQLSIRDAKRIVRTEKVPFIALKTFDMNIGWKFVRFQVEAVTSWEASRERRATSPEPYVPQRIPLKRMRPRS